MATALAAGAFTGDGFSAEATPQSAAKLEPKTISASARHDAGDIPFRRAPMNVATRSVHIPLTTNLHVAFDTELLRTHAVWTGPTLNLWGSVYHQGKDRFYCNYDGTRLWGNPAIMPWTLRHKTEEGFVDEEPSFRFRGLSTKGGETTVIYELTHPELKRAVIHESFRHRPGVPETILERRYEISPCGRSLTLMAHLEDHPLITGKLELPAVVFDRRTNVLLVAARASCNLKLESRTVPVDFESKLWREKKGDSVVDKVQVTTNLSAAVVRIPVHASNVVVEVLSLVAPDVATGLRQLREFPKSAIPPADMNFIISTNRDTKAVRPWVGTGAKDFLPPAGDPHYRLESFPLPRRIELLVTGMDFLPNGDLAVCTWLGEIYIVEGVQGPPAAAKYRRFARGLCEPGGLKMIDGRMYVVQKQELTRIADTDGNGEADLFQCICQDWGFTGNHRDFSYGPVRDMAGNFHVFRTGAQGVYDVPYMGWDLRITPDGNRVEPVCSGLRSPNGFGSFGPDADIFVTENQGNWIGACKLNHLRPGRFYGFPSSFPAPRQDFAGKRDGKFTPPAVWFPHNLAKSTSGMETISDDRFGPFKGQLLVGDFQNAIVTRVMLERVRGEWQGAVFPFAKGFGSGVNRLAMGPDGKLYVGGLKNKAWAAVAPREWSLDRLSYTGKLPFEVKEVHVLDNGFDLTFTQPVEARTGANPGSYDIVQFGYPYQEKYGSAEFDHAGKENRSTGIAVTKATLSPDRLKVRLTLQGWKTGYVTMVRCLDVVNDEGRHLRESVFWYTLNQLPGS